MGILIGVFSVAIFTDWRCYRIPNLCIGIGAVAGLIMTYVSYSFAGTTIDVEKMGYEVSRLVREVVNEVKSNG